jgi:glycosyltransferase involved in cell wall biosynthesis
MPQPYPSVVIVADNASYNFGGEAVLPLRYFKIMRRKGVEVRLITHDRNRAHLASVLHDEVDRILFVPDSWVHRLCVRTGGFLPGKVANFTVGLVGRTVTQLRARSLARQLIRSKHAQVVFQPIPVSPKEISYLYRMGAPVVMGPFNGNMGFPPAFSDRESRATLLFTSIMRRISHLVNWLIPGKLRADLLLVANQRTRAALPWGVRGRVIEMVENGVELDLWPTKTDAHRAGGPTRFIYLGRLVEVKGVDILIKAFAKASSRLEATLEIVGDGELRHELETLTASLNLTDRVVFSGWLAQAQASQRLRDSDVFVLPSLHECGGAAVMEAMAVGIPVIATKWGGPVDYVDSSCGILVEPSSESALINGMAEAMIHLAQSADLRAQMGAAGRRRIEEHFDWDQKVEQLLGLFVGLCQASSPTSQVDKTRSDSRAAGAQSPTTSLH